MNLVSDEYYSIERPSQAVYKDQKSRFLAFAYPVESEEEVCIHFRAAYCAVVQDYGETARLCENSAEVCAV